MSAIRGAGAITAGNLVSRLTGFVRIVVMGAVLGTTVLGDTYQSANTVPNVIFELFAAGSLQAVLVPALVRSLDADGPEAADRLAGRVLGALLVVLGAFAVLAAVVAPLVSRGLFAGADDAVRSDQVALATVLLWIFLPQVVCYAAGAVATGVLHARDRFAAPAFAPLVNNIVVSAAYGLFWVLHHDDADPLHLDGLELLVLGGGTTLGVVAFTAVPALAARRAGARVRPEVSLRDRGVRALARQGAWAGVYLALFQVVLVAALVVGNTVEGGVVTWQLAYTYFLLPHALVAIPSFTAAYPGLARAAHAGDEADFADRLRQAVTAVLVLGLPATAALVALGPAGTDLTLFGASARSAGEVADVLAALAPGLVGYGLFLLLTRAAYARGDVRLPATVHAGVTAAAVAGMAVAAVAFDGIDVIVAMAAAHSVAFLGGAAVLGVRLRRSAPAGGRWVDLRAGAGAASGAVVAGAVMAAVAAVVGGGGGRGQAALVLGAGGALGLAVHLGVLTLAKVPLTYALRRPEPAAVAGG